MGSKIPDKALRGSSGKGIPVIGYGTAEFPFGASNEAVKEAVVHAIKIGYRHFDTAAVYQSEQPLADAIADALRLGFIHSREDLFITTKLWCSSAHPHLVLPALKQSLQNLKMEYVDLYLIHWPVSMNPASGLALPANNNFVPMDLKSVWEAMEECQNLGLAKSIGVSNFSTKKLETLLSTATIPPLVNQVEMNPKWQQKKLRELCEQKGVYITACTPLGGIGSVWGSNQVIDCEVLKKIAAARGKTVAQICLRWAYEQGVIVVVKSSNKERMKENMEIFDWELTLEDSHKISQIPQKKTYNGIEYISEDGPFKSIEELWDGEI